MPPPPLQSPGLPLVLAAALPWRVGIFYEPPSSR